MDILELYKSMLLFAGIHVSHDGYLFYYLDGKKESLLITGLAVVLPTKEHLRTNNIKEKIIFHPLAEDSNATESVIITRLTSTINARLNLVFAALAQSLVSLAASPADHHILSPEQSELVIMLGDVDETSAKNFVNVMMNSFKLSDYRYFVKMYVKRRGVIGENTYTRMGNITFPFLEKLIKDEGEELDKLRAKDKVIYQRLYEFILPGSKITGNFNYGTRSATAPFLHALYKTAGNIASLLNELIIDFAPYIDGYDKLLFNTDWIETFENLEVMGSQIRRIPSQDGNSGEVVITPPLTPIATAVSQAQPVMNTPAPINLPTPTVAQYHQQSFIPQVQQMQQPVVKRTSGGLDYNSLMAVLPPVNTGMNNNLPQVNNSLPLPQFMHQYSAPVNQFPQQNTYYQQSNNNSAGFR